MRSSYPSTSQARCSGRMDSPHGYPQSFRIVGGYGDADLLRFRRSQPNVHPGLRGLLRLGSAYGFLQGAWPFGLLEAIWSLVAFGDCLGGGAALFCLGQIRLGAMGQWAE